ncbi:MAG: hypothetical protein ABIB97_05305 [Patescibacteria group bacterium]
MFEEESPTSGKKAKTTPTKSTDTPDPKNFKGGKNPSAWKWVVLIATPFVILIIMAIFGLVRLAGEETVNSSDNANTSYITNSNTNIPIANLNLSLREDSDFDGLIDYLELRIGTGITTYDTDEDTYLDGEEVLSGFSPKGRGSFTGEQFSDFCLGNFENTDELDYNQICSFVTEYIEVIRRMTQDESGASDKDLDTMVIDFCQANAEDLNVCQSAIDLALSVYMMGVEEVTNENINLNININGNLNTNT